MKTDSEIIPPGIAGLKVLGFSKPMVKVYHLIERTAKSDATVLILGETGTGKELVARGIHMNSKRKDKPFVAVNCSAFAENLFESELFGHVKGAYTNALKDKKGRFELAHGGTLFLDEIGELSKSLQVKLLRVLQEKTFENVGGSKTIKVDVRILAATNKDLKKEVLSGRFREDLFYRLNVIKITVPPLRDRKEDIAPLINHFKRKYARKNSKCISKISYRAIDILNHYSFPGNVRELENLMERAVVLATGREITVNEWPKELLQNFKYCKFPDMNYYPKRDELLKALLEINVINRSGKPVNWHKTIKCIAVVKMYDFFVETGCQWFSRKEFAKFLRNRSKADTDKYKTAGDYLKILKENKICVHNGKKANKSRYRLARCFIAKESSC